MENDKGKRRGKMDCIEVKGNTLEEAIAEGLKQLQATREDVVVEIVQQERKKLFGIVSQPAVVRLTKKHQTKQTVQQKEGKAWIQDGDFCYECLDVYQRSLLARESFVCITGKRSKER